MIDKRGIVIFSGYNQRAVIAFLRTLESNKINEYAILARDEEDQILITRYSGKVLLVRKDSSLSVRLFSEYADKLRRELGWDSFLIAPSTEGLNRFVLDERDALEKLGYMVPLVNKRLYVEISDKKSFSEMCKENGFTIPKEFSIPEKFERRFVAKPISYRFNDDNKVYTPLLIRNKEDYNKFRAAYPEKAFYFQEYLEKGDSIYLLYYFSKHDKVFSLLQRNIAQQDEGGSMIISELYDKDINEDRLFQRLFKRIGFFGFLMVELREYKDKCYVIEANPRFWGPAQLFVDSGYNFFEAFLSDWGFMQKEPDKETVDTNAYYYWSGGRIKDIKSGKKSIIYTDDRKILDNVPDMIDKFDIYRREDTVEIWRSEID